MSVSIDGSSSTTLQRPHSSTTTPTAGPGSTPLSAGSPRGAGSGRTPRPQQRRVRNRGRSTGTSTTEGSEPEDRWRQVALWLELWASNQKVAGSNPQADKVKICHSAPEQGS
jgi:hypothetical protein